MALFFYVLKPYCNICSVLHFGGVKLTMENNNAKVIKLKINGKIVERLMTIEEVHKQFNNMIKNFANDCVVQSKTMHNNVDAFEDFVSEGYIVLVECFKSYSPTFTLSSYLSSALDLTRKE